MKGSGMTKFFLAAIVASCIAMPAMAGECKGTTFDQDKTLVLGALSAHPEVKGTAATVDDPDTIKKILDAMVTVLGPAPFDRVVVKKMMMINVGPNVRVQVYSSDNCRIGGATMTAERLLKAMGEDT